MASNQHHRLPRHRNGGDNASNLVRVDDKRHHYFHALWNTMTPEAIVKELNETWLEPDVTLLCFRHKGRRLTKAQIEEAHRELRRILG